MSEEPSKPEQPPEKKLCDVLTEKSAALNVHESVQEAGRKLRALEADSLPVADERRLVGMVTERHPDRRAASHGHDPKVERVGDFMSRNVVFCYEDQDRGEAESLMKDKNLKFLPIVDREMRIVGILRAEDLSPSAASAASGASS